MGLKMVIAVHCLVASSPTTKRYSTPLMDSMSRTRYDDEDGRRKRLLNVIWALER